MELESHKQLLSRLGNICKHHKELARASGAEFNLFKIIKVSNDEVKHSAFLAELLNPKGSHGQGDIFLSLFVGKIGVMDFHCETADVIVEKHLGEKTDSTGGRVDILIIDNRGNYIIIENKIYANDQENQLIRYYNYKNQNLYYLTLYGTDATEKSKIDDKLGVKLECDKDYKLLSYKTDILEWLEQCHKESVSMPLLREGISHYINLIKSLTGTSINRAMTKEIINLLTENPNNLANAREIANNFTNAKISIQSKFWKELKIALLNNNIDLKEDEKTVNGDKIWNFYNKKEKPYGLWSQIYKKDNYSFHWGCEIYDTIHFGFTIEKNGGGKISNDTKYKSIRNILKELDHNYESNEWFLGKQNTDPQLNFREFKGEDIFSLADKRIMEMTVQKIAEKAKRDIENFVAELEKIEIEKNILPVLNSSMP